MAPGSAPGPSSAFRGVRTPLLVAKAVMDCTDHHLLVGTSAQAFARQMGFTVEDDLNTANSRTLWREWKRRSDPEHWLDPTGAGRSPRDRHEKVPGGVAAHLLRERQKESRALVAGRTMVRDGLIPEGSFWGTINCEGIGPKGAPGAVKPPSTTCPHS